MVPTGTGYFAKTVTGTGQTGTGYFVEITTGTGYLDHRYRLFRENGHRYRSAPVQVIWGSNLTLVLTLAERRSSCGALAVRAGAHHLFCVILVHKVDSEQTSVNLGQSGVHGYWLL